jgi:glycosyltransferase involved in cell wall biosynthesis
VKIIFFAPASHEQGTYFRWHNLAIGLRRLGHEVQVLAFGSSKKKSSVEDRDGIAYHILPTSYFGTRLVCHGNDPIATLRSLLSPPPPADIIHVFQPFSLSCVRALAHKARARALFYDWDDLWWGGLINKPPHGFSRAGLSARIIQLLEYQMPRLAHHVTTCSDFLGCLASERGARETTIIHNGYWPHQDYSSQPQSRAALRLDPEAFYFGFMGRTTGELEWCFDALQLQSIQERPVRLALCGMPQYFLGRLTDSQRNRIDHLGQLTAEQARLFAKSIDCGLLPLENTSFNQSRFPIKFAEYLAAGTHVLASAVGEIATLAQGINGVKIVSPSREAWRASFGSFVDDQTLPHSDYIPGPELAELLSWDVLAAKLAKTYSTAL